MEKAQEMLYLTNKMCNRISEMKIDSDSIKNLNPKNKKDLIKITTMKLNLEDYLKELEEIKKSSNDLEKRIDKDDFVLKGIISGNNIIINDRINEFTKLKNSIDSFMKTFETNNKLSNMSNK